MSVFISDKDTAKLHVQFFGGKITPNLNIECKNELIYIRYFEAVQKTRNRVLSGLKTIGFASSFKPDNTFPLVF